MAKTKKKAQPRAPGPHAPTVSVPLVLAFRLANGERVGQTETAGRSDYDRQLDGWIATKLLTAGPAAAGDDRYFLVRGSARYAEGFFPPQIAGQIQVWLAQIIYAILAGTALPPPSRTDFGECVLEAQIISSYEELAKFIKPSLGSVTGGEEESGGAGAGQAKKRPARPLPGIRLEELSRAEVKADRLQAAGVRLVQQVLDRLAGRRGETPGVNKDIAERVRKLAQRFGLTLHLEGRPTYFVWNKGVFVASTTDSSREHLGSSPEFLPLIALPKGIAPDGKGPEAAAKSHAEKVRRRPGAGGRDRG